MWTIQLFGGLAVSGQQRQLTRFRTQKAASLLGYLAFHASSAHQPRPRETLIGMLWPDAEPDAGRHNLSNALSFLRHVLEPTGVPAGTVILADRNTVRLNPAAATVDVIEFESDLNKAEAGSVSDAERMELLMRAVELYQGPLLPGDYEEWIAPQAVRLENLFVQTVVRLVPMLVNAGKSDSAVSFAQKAVAADPLSEEATLCLMQALSASGHSSPALKAYRALAQRLNDALDVEPSPEIQQLAAKLGQGGAARKSLDAVEQEVVVPPPRPAITETPETVVVTEPDSSAQRGRLIGPEFLLRTTTRFFDREEEIDRLGKMLSTPRTRLVTLTGPGGTGKTRLSLEVAARLVERTEDTPLEGAPTGAVFVSLAPLTGVERLYDVTLRSFGIIPTFNQEPLAQLVGVLDARPNTLLVLDNFEQLVEEGALQINDLLGKSAGVKLLITSRQKLQIEGEREFHLAPLPTCGGVQALEEMQQAPSVALFVDCAQAALPDFQLTERNAPAISQLCDYLEGLPLAIELAAARLSLLSPARILEQVQSNRLDFLATRRRDAESRQKTLRATLDWSYRLLPDSARTFLAALSTFRGGWTLEAAQAVVGTDDETTLELTTLLRDSSLIGVKDTDEGLRFTMLETIREYASEQLDHSGERHDISKRHQEYFLFLARLAEDELSGPRQPQWMDRLEIEYENLLAAISSSLKSTTVVKQTTDGKRTENEKQPSSDSIPLLFCAALDRFWSAGAHLREGRALCKAALQAEGSESRTAARAKTLGGAGELARLQGDYKLAKDFFAESLAIFREIEDKRAIGRSLNSLGIVSWHLGDYTFAQECFDESLSTLREIGDREGIGSTLKSLGNVAFHQGDFIDARARYQESVDMMRELGDSQRLANALSNLGNAALAQGDLAATRTFYHESLAICREISYRLGAAHALTNLGVMANDGGDYAAAQEYLDEALSIKRQIGEPLGIAIALTNLGNTVFARGDCAAAVPLLNESLAILRDLGDKWVAAYSVSILGLVAHAQGDFAAAKKLFAETLAIRREVGDKRGIATAIERFASLAGSEGRPKRAARLWGGAEAMREAIGAPMPAGERAEHSVCVASAREAAGQADFSAAWNEGRAMTMEQAVDFALEDKLGAA